MSVAPSIVRAYAISQLGLPFLLLTGEPFVYIPCADAMFGTQAANN